MAGTTALLKSAASLQAKIRTQQDALAQFEWENSAQTYDDYLQYSNYINGQKTKTSDPGDLLTYETKSRSALRSFTSNEIQRAQIDVMEGRGNIQTKMSRVEGLYKQAVDNGDYNLAQNLVSQWDSLSIQAQNEADAAAKAASGGRGGGGSSSAIKADAATKRQIRDLVANIKDSGDYVQLPDGTVVKSFKQLSNELKQSGNARFASGATGNLFKEASETYLALSNYLNHVLTTTQSQDIADFLAGDGSATNNYRDFIEGNSKIKIGGMDLTFDDINNASVNDSMNNPLYFVKESRGTDGNIEYNLQKNQLAQFNYVYSPDNGGYVALPVTTSQRDKFESLSNPITDNGELIDPTTGNYNYGQNNLDPKKNKDALASMSIQKRLENLGYTVLSGQGADGTFQMQNNTTGEVVQAIVQDGKIRYFGQPGQYSGGQAGLYEIDPTKTDGGALREVAPDETSDFGVQSNFGGLNSQMTPIGARARDLFTGAVAPNRNQFNNNQRISTKPGDLLTQGPAAITPNFQGGTNTTQLLQQATNRQQTLARAKAAADAAAAYQLQASRTSGLNQTTVRQSSVLNNAPVRQLVVAKPKALPAVKVVQAKPVQKIVVPKTTPVGNQITLSGRSLQG